jgi:hypothetical protein
MKVRLILINCDWDNITEDIFLVSTDIPPVTNKSVGYLISKSNNPLIYKNANDSNIVINKEYNAGINIFQFFLKRIALLYKLNK